MTDLVLRGGVVVDGTGGPAHPADVAVSDGRIEAIGPGLRGDRVLDASGLFVTPGFVDLHTHYDAQVLWDAACTPSAWHGVTSVVAGNCGFSFAPCRPEDRELVMRTLERVEDMPYASLAAGIDWDFETYGEYLDGVARRGCAVNFGGHVGHTTVRIYVMGEAAYEREATAHEVAEMAAVVERSVLAGALGFSTSTIELHRGWQGRSVPSNVASQSEIEALMRAVGRVGQGIIQASPERDVDWLYELQPELGCNITWSALLAYPSADLSRSYRQQLDAVHRGRQRSDRVWAQVTCRPITAELTMAEPVAFFVVPAFSELSALDAEGRAAAYASPVWRDRAWAEIESHRYRDPRWDKVVVVATEAAPELIGRDLASVAAERGCRPIDVLLDVALADHLAARFHTTLANDDEAAVTELLRDPACVLGLSDAGAHVGQLCDAVLPTDFLSRWVRDRGVLSLEAGVHKLTGELADVAALAGRGVLRPGAAADIVAFDLDALGPGPVRRVSDLPGGAARLLGDQPSGIAHVVVNGRPICADGHRLVSQLDRLPGAVLRSRPRAGAATT